MRRIDDGLTNQHRYVLRMRAARPVAFCDHCGKPRGNRPKFCVACGMKTSRHRQGLAKRGLCVCHKPLAAGKRRCAKCLAKNAARMKAKSKARIAEGLCQKCGRKAEPGFAHCAQHLEYTRARYWTKRGLPVPPRRPKLTPQERRRPTRGR